MQKIIGLDIGSYSIKAVEIINRFKTYEISNFYENPIPQIDEISPDSTIPTCMEQLFVENNLQADRIITAMPGQYISSRILSFQFSDPRKIQAAVYAEIEDAVPFNLEEMIVDHQILGQMGDRTVALVVMTRKKFLSSFLEHLQLIDIDPKLVDVDSLTFYNLCPYLEMKPERCYGLVDVGHEKTSVCLVQDGVLRMFRSINLGGRYITEFLARDLEIPFNEAQRIKHQVSRVLTADDTEPSESDAEGRIAKRITLASNTIVKDLGRTLYAFKTWEDAPIERIYLSGGTSLIKNFDLYLSEHLGVETVPNRLEESGLQLNPEIAAKMPVLTQGIAIGIRAVSSVKRHSQINLRKNEFAFVQNYDALFQAAGVIARVFAFALLLLTFSYMMKYFSYSQQIDDLQAAYKKEVDTLVAKPKKGKATIDRSEFAKVHKSARSEISGRINDKKAAISGFEAINSESGSLVALHDISMHIPKEVKVEMIEYVFETQPDGSGKVKLKVEANSFETAAAFQQALQTVPSFVSVEEKKTEPKPGAPDIKVATYEAVYSTKKQSM